MHSHADGICLWKYEKARKFLTIPCARRKHLPLFTVSTSQQSVPYARREIKIVRLSWMQLKPWSPQTLFLWCMCAFLPNGFEPEKEIKNAHVSFTLASLRLMNIRMPHISLLRTSRVGIGSRDQFSGQHFCALSGKAIETLPAPGWDVERTYFRRTVDYSPVRGRRCTSPGTDCPTPAGRFDCPTPAGHSAHHSSAIGPNLPASPQTIRSSDGTSASFSGRRRCSAQWQSQTLSANRWGGKQQTSNYCRFKWKRKERKATR